MNYNKNVIIRFSLLKCHTIIYGVNKMFNLIKALIKLNLVVFFIWLIYVGDCTNIFSSKIFSYCTVKLVDILSEKNIQRIIFETYFSS